MNIDTKSPGASMLPLAPAPLALMANPAKDFVYKGARILLEIAHNKTPSTAPLVHRLQARHALHLLKFPIGRDLTLVTEAGVEFKIHPIMISGGSKYLEARLYQECPLQKPPTSIMLPKECHPILVDRLVTFLYTKDYALPQSNLLSSNMAHHNLTNAWFVPKYSTPAPGTTALIKLPPHVFHLHMYTLGEQLQYEALMAVARAKLWSILHRCMQSPTPVSWVLLNDCVDACFPQPGPETRLCKDEDGALQQMIVAAVLYNEAKEWNAVQRKKFIAHFPVSQYGKFWAVVKDVKSENADMLGSGSSPNQSTSQEHRASDQTRKQTHIEPRQANAARSIRGVKPSNTSGCLRNDLAFANDAHRYFIEEAQRRRNKKTEARKTMTERALADNAKGFDSIDKVTVRANLAVLMNKSPSQFRNITASQGMSMSGITVRDSRPLPSSMNFTYGPTSQDIREGDRSDDEGVEEGNHDSMWLHSDKDFDADIRNGVQRMKIDGDHQT